MPSIRAILFSIAMGLTALLPTADAARTADHLLFSKVIWGMPSERVAQALKLDRSQYTVLHDPGDLRITIYQMDGKPINFPEFRVVYLNFKPDAGLFKVNGFYHGGMDEAVTALKARYGNPDVAKRSGPNPLFQWNFEATALSINSNQFEIAPKP